MSARPADDVLDRLFAQARDVVLGERDRFDVSFEELAHLVSDEVLQARFQARLRLEAQNKEARELILLFLRGVASKEEEAAEEIATDAEGMDKYVGRVGIGTTAAAIAMFTTPSGFGAALLLIAGLVAMASGGITSNILKKRANRHRAFARRIRDLVKDDRDA